MSAIRCRTIAVLINTALLVLGVNAQQPASPDQRRTYAAPDGAFRFSYPNDFQVCTKDKIQPCIQSYIPVCEQDALVCVIYPAEKFKDTSFGAASFQVRKIVVDDETMTADICATPYPRDHGTTVQYPEFLISAEHPTEMIGGVSFIHGLSGGAAMSHSNIIDLYRAFQDGRCWEVSVSQTGTNPMVSDPPMKTPTPAQQKKLDRTLSDILHSFRFTK